MLLLWDVTPIGHVKKVSCVYQDSVRSRMEVAGSVHQKRWSRLVKRDIPAELPVQGGRGRAPEACPFSLALCSKFATEHRTDLL